MPVKDADRQLELRAQAARIKAYLPTLRERHVTLTLELGEVETLLRAERAELTKLMDEADELGPKKRCSFGGKWLPVAQFHKSAQAPDGLQYDCKDCANARARWSHAERQKARTAVA